MDTSVTTEAWDQQEGEAQCPSSSSSAGSGQRDLSAPILKELGLPSLEGGTLGS